MQCSVISDQVPYITWLKHTTRDNGVDSQGKVINRLLIIKVKIREENLPKVHYVGLMVVGAGGGIKYAIFKKYLIVFWYIW